MSKKSLSILIVPPSTDRVRQYSIPQWLVRVAFAGLATLVVGFISSLGIATYGLNKADVHKDYATENVQLKAALTGITADLKVLQEQLGRLESAERKVRSVFGFPEVDSDVRALGVGGPVAQSETPLSESEQLTFAIESEIDRMLHRTKFERENYESIFSALLDQKQRLDHTPSIFPVNGILMRGLGVKPDPFTGKMKPHNGIDLAAPVGTPIYAPAAGKIILREKQVGMGNTIVIDHGYGLESTYGHLSRFAAKNVKDVRRGDIIGYVGNTGYSTGPHLHYELRNNGKLVDPMKYVYDKAPDSGAELAKMAKASAKSGA